MSTTHQVNTVIHVSSAHPYTDNRIHFRECQSLADAGFEIQLVAVDAPTAIEPSTVRVTRIPRRRRLARMLISSSQAVLIAIRSKAKIVHLHDPELIPYIPILQILRRIVVYDAHEDLPLQILDKPYVNRATRRIFSFASKVVLGIAQRADLIVAATEGIADRFPASKTVLVRNYPPLRPEEDALPGWGERENTAVYIGALSKSRGAIEMLEAAQHASFPEGWQLHIAGFVTPDVLPALEAATATKRVRYLNQLPPLQARDLLLRAKVGLVTLSDTPAYRTALPTKLFEYFAAGLPAIASDFPLWRRIVTEASGGTLVNQSSPSAIAGAIAKYARDPEQWSRESTAARRAALAELNWNSEADVLVRAYLAFSSDAPR